VQLVQLAGVLARGLGLVAPGLGLGAFLDPHPLYVVGLVGLDDGLAVEMPAFPALGCPQRLGPFGARGADGGEGVPARDEHLGDLAGLDVGAAELHRPHAPAIGDGQLADHGTSERHGQSLGAGGSWCHSASWSPGCAGSSGSVACQRAQ